MKKNLFLITCKNVFQLRNAGVSTEEKKYKVLLKKKLLFKNENE